MLKTKISILSKSVREEKWEENLQCNLQTFKTLLSQEYLLYLDDQPGLA